MIFANVVEQMRQLFVGFAGDPEAIFAEQILAYPSFGISMMLLRRDRAASKEQEGLIHRQIAIISGPMKFDRAWRNKVTKYRWIFCVTIGLAAMFLSPSSSDAQEPEKLVIGHSNLRNDIAALWVPKELGLFRKHGVEATVVLITGGARMTQAMLSGSSPMAFTGATPVVSAVGGGGDSVLILGINNKLTYDIWARAEIKKPEELKGKTIGISGFGSSSHVASFLMLQHFNLDEKRDRITFVTIGDEPTRAQAVLAGRVDATLMDASISGQIKGRGPTYLGNLEQLGVPFVNNALVTTRSFLKERPKTAEAVVKVIVEGNAFILNPANRSTVTNIVAKNLRLSGEDAKHAYDDLIPKVERRPYPNLDAVKAAIQIMGVRNPKIAQLKTEDIVDTSILRRLEQSGFIRQ
jgi:NitT/TauT family transport system substrate-binding protein